MKKHLTRLVILGTVLVGGYFLLTRENASSYTIPFIEVRTKEIVEKLGSVAGGVKKYAAGQATATVSVLADNFTDTVLEKSEQLVQQVFDGAKNSAFKFFRQSVNQKVDSVGANLGIDVQQLGTEVPPPAPESPIVFGIGAGTPAYFSIKNREAEKITYEAAWQDGKKSIGEVAAGKSVVISHQWSSSGEYYPKFKITTSRGSKIYEIAISVISL